MEKRTPTKKKELAERLIRVTPTTHERLKVTAAKERVTMADLVTKMLYERTRPKRSE